MNGCYSSEWYDASAVMMRRLVEIAIIEAFEKKGVAHKIKDGADKRPRKNNSDVQLVGHSV